jgi:hypothetical protein
MLDTTVYLDALKAPGLPTSVATLMARNVVLHSAIACAELAVRARKEITKSGSTV